MFAMKTETGDAVIVYVPTVKQIVFDSFHLCFTVCRAKYHLNEKARGSVSSSSPSRKVEISKHLVVPLLCSSRESLVVKEF